MFSTHLSKCPRLNLMVKQSTRWRQTPVRSVKDVLQSNSRVGGIVYLWTEPNAGLHPKPDHTPLARACKAARVCLLPRVSKACIHLCRPLYNVCLMKSPIESEEVGPHAYS